MIQILPAPISPFQDFLNTLQQVGPDIGKGFAGYQENKKVDALSKIISDPNKSAAEKYQAFTMLPKGHQAAAGQAFGAFIGPQAQQEALHGRRQQVLGQSRQPQPAAQPLGQALQQSQGQPQQSTSPLERATALQVETLAAEGDPEAIAIQKQQAKKTASAEAGLKDTVKIRQGLAEKANAANAALQSEERMLELIKEGDLNDPTLAAIAEKIPFHLGERFLNPATTEYRSNLINEYNQLRTLFKGQTRVSEINILKEKLPNLYLTDTQKERILKNSMKKLKADVIESQVAADLERDHPEYGALQFQNELDKRVKPELKKLSDDIIDEYKSIAKEAESTKSKPLDSSNPEHVSIAREFLRKAGGDKKKAEQLLKKAGYKV